MANITLHSDSQTSATSVSNIFIDEYMSDANGEFVKIYLYLLRQLNAPDAAFSISAMADKFEHTEKDIKRALSYWERMHLLRLEYDSSENLTGVCFLDTKRRPSENEDPMTVSTQETASSEYSAAVSPEESSLKPSVPEPKNYSAEDISMFRKQESVAELLFIAERYLGRILTPTDMNSILYWYDGLGFSTDLIEYLVEYCVSKGHTSIRYIEKVALNWYQAGIHTQDEAREHSTKYSKDTSAVMKAFGSMGRNAGTAEQEFMRRWFKEFGFDSAIVTEACNRTLTATGSASFPYADKILTGWKENGVRTLQDVKILDKRRQEKQKKSAGTPKQNRNTSRNRFNNFEQRSYNYDNYVWADIRKREKS